MPGVTVTLAERAIWLLSAEGTSKARVESHLSAEDAMSKIQCACKIQKHLQLAPLEESQAKGIAYQDLAKGQRVFVADWSKL